MGEIRMIGKLDPIPLVLKPANRNIYTTDQLYNVGVITSSGTGGLEVDNGFSFTFGALDGYASLAAVFDQYRIIQISVTFAPTLNMVTSSSGGVQVGNFYTVIDFDNAATANVAALRQYENCMTTPAYAPQTRTFTPHVALAAYGGAFTSYANEGPKWIDSASTAVQHYGVKTALTSCAVTSTIIYEVTARLVIQLRNTQ